MPAPSQDLSPSARALQARLRRVGALILVSGAFAAALVYWKAPPPDPMADLLSGKNTKSYELQMELIGGKANLLADESKDSFLGLFQGRELAFTLATLSAASALICFFMAHRLAYSSLPQDRVGR